jgi:hypothetical protein
MQTKTASRSKVEYTLAGYQDEFINSDHRKIAIVGAKGSSKSFCGARFILVQVAKQPGAQGIVMFNTLQQARDVYFQDMEPLLKDLNWPYSFNAQTMVLKVFDSTIHYRSAEPDAVRKIESIEYCFGWADEASYYNPESLKTFVSRIRKGKAMVRITSMPDEPDAFIYNFLEKGDYKMHEISLKNNPDREFAERYEEFLKTIYSEQELKRWLDGDRVSLTGMSMFALDQSMKIGTGIDPNEDLLLSWDFNSEYRAVSAWQQIGISEIGSPIIACVNSWQMRQANVYEDAVILAKELKGHQKRILLHGDASGNARTAAATQPMWQSVRKAFIEGVGNEKIRYIVPSSNPNVKDTILCANWALRNGLVKFASHEKSVFSSLMACRADRYGEIDKSSDYRGGEGARSHEADTARYAIWHYFKNAYPGRKRVFIA